MLKLLKYELKGNYKACLSMLLTALILSLAFMCFKKDSGAVLAINLVAGFITLTTVIKAWENEMYEAQGYLTFTLPEKGRTILGAKIIGAFIWFVLCFLLAVITHLLQTDSNFLVFLYHYLPVLSIGINIMFMGYFCIAVTRVGNSDKKLGKFIGVIVFILLIVLIFIVKIKLVNSFSTSINMPFNKGTIYQGCSEFISFNGNSNMRIDSSGLHINVSTLIFNILFLIGLFEATVYLIDKKIDL